MNQVLLQAFYEVVDELKKDSRCLGGWHFGSIARGLDDEYSDVDPIFVIDGDHFEEFNGDLKGIFSKMFDEVITFWPESFNNDEIKNYGIDIRIKGKIYQFDIFLLNSKKLDGWWCKIHYTDAKLKDVIFDRTGSIHQLLSNAPKGEIPERDLLYIIETYWQHVHMILKYFHRKDYFKVLKVIDVLMKSHVELLLAEYDKISWGGWESKVKYVPHEKQEHLKKYFASNDLELMKLNVRESIGYFSADAKEICMNKQVEYPFAMEKAILSDGWGEL
jgi:predicted nucleotidyltransferase